MNLHDAHPITVDTVGARVRILDGPQTHSFAGLVGTVEEVDDFIVVRIDPPTDGTLFLYAKELELV